MKFDDILKLIHNQENREELRYLGQRYYDTQRETSRADTSGQKELLDEIIHRIHLQYRAIRRPLPTQKEVEEMIVNYFTS